MKSGTLREWATIDKSEWAEGPWHNEPDKRQWVDESSGLPCLMVRGNLGFWCGYVGLRPGHPLHGASYDSADTAGIEVHGGLTFTDGCAVMDRAEWRKRQVHFKDSQKEIARYPKGDAARYVKDWGSVINDYEAWRGRMQATHVCHIPEADEPDNIHWLGFDCGHAGDLAPGVRALLSSVGHPERPEYDEQYRDLACVQAEVESLALQLKNYALEKKAA